MTSLRMAAFGVYFGIALSIGGCAGSAPRLYVNSEADMNYYKKVAVLPFENLTQERFAGDRITRSFITELIIADRFQILDPADFWTILERIGGTPGVQGNYDPKKLQAAAKEASANGIIRGAVTEYQMLRNGTSEVPVLSFYAEMSDVETGNVVWRASISKRGRGRTPIVGGGGDRTFGKMSQEACRDLVARLQREAF